MLCTLAAGSEWCQSGQFQPGGLCPDSAGSALGGGACTLHCRLGWPCFKHSDVRVVVLHCRHALCLAVDLLAGSKDSGSCVAS